MRRVLAMTFAVLATACASEDRLTLTRFPSPVAADYAGFWVLESIAVDSRDGETIEYRREGPAAALRGDFRFVDASEASGVLSGRIAILEDGLIRDGRLTRFDFAVTLDGTAWYLAEDGAFAGVFEAALEDDRLVLLRQGPERNGLPRRLSATRADPWSFDVQGEWRIASAAWADGRTLVEGACTAWGEGSARAGGTWSIDDLWMIEEETVVQTFADRACLAVVETVKRERRGMVETFEPLVPMPGDDWCLLRSWTAGPAGTDPLRAEWEMTFRDDGGKLALSRFSCSPSGCEDELPVRVLLRAVEPRP